MVLIFSEEVEMSTDSVCEWIDYLGGKFERVNGALFSEKAVDFSYSLTLNSKAEIDFSFQIKGKDFPGKAVKSVWFRRDEPLKIINFFNPLRDPDLKNTLISHGHREIVRAKEYFYAALLQKPHIGNHLVKELNKFHTLFIAAKNGLEIPESMLSNNIRQQQKFIKRGPTINKAVKETDFFKSSSGDVFVSYTSLVSQNDISPSGFPSFFQAKVEKEFEIRVFFLKGKFYPMAIFSQADNKTAVDYRRYNLGKPNRNVPYKLPFHIEEGLHKTMTDLGLDNGSADLIKTIDGRFIFLEVNPVGQFGMTSKPCNYYIEKEIAQILLSK